MNGPLSVAALAAGLRSGQLSARGIAEESLRRAEHHRALNIFLHLDSAEVLAQADRADAELRAGVDRGPLHGLPVALKDNLCVAGGPLTCGSRFLEGYRAPYSATVVDRLVAAGAVLFGKTNLDEFAMGSSNENSAYGPVRNPLDPERVPGGSSGGSAAAVAAGIVPLALGSDTGGSVRQPASLCGIVGLKPTYGRVSRHGLVAFASSLDQIGPFAVDVPGAAALLDVLCGLDPNDSTTVDQPAVGWSSEPPRAVHVGVPKQYLVGLSDEARTALIRVLDACPDLRWTEVDLPSAELAVATYYVIASAEASSNLARFDGIRYGRRAAGQSLIDVYVESRTAGFGPEVKRRIMLGTFALSAGYYDAYYGRANDARDAMVRDHARAFLGVDALVGPTSPTTAFRLGERAADPIAMYLSDIFTIPANLAGLPAISVPGLRDGGGLPFGIHVVARAFDERMMLSIGERLMGTAAKLEGR